MQSVVTSSIIAPNSDPLPTASTKTGRGHPDVDSNERDSFSELMDSNAEASNADLNTGAQSNTIASSPPNMEKSAPVMRVLDTAEVKPSPTDTPPVMPRLDIPAPAKSTPVMPTIAPGQGDSSALKGGPPVMPTIEPEQGNVQSTKTGTPVMPAIDPASGDTPAAKATLPVTPAAGSKPAGSLAAASEAGATVQSAGETNTSTVHTPETVTAANNLTGAAQTVAAGVQSQTQAHSATPPPASKSHPDAKSQAKAPAMGQTQATAATAPASSAAAQILAQRETKAVQTPATPAPILADGDEPEISQAVSLASGRKSNSKSNNVGQSTPSFSGAKQAKTAISGSTPNPAATANMAKSPAAVPEAVFDPAISAQKPVAMSVPGIIGETAQVTSQLTENGQTTSLTTDAASLRSDGPANAERSSQAMARFTPRAATQLAAQITQRFNNGSRVFDIRLDPAELGRVDVRLELMPDQRVHAVLTAERGETLAELQRTARELEQALKDAGLDLADSGLEFQLNEDMDQQDFDRGDAADTVNLYAESDPNAVETDTDNQPREAYGFLLARRDSVDLRV
jgi:flagellar hook-length control protein FliK